MAAPKPGTPEWDALVRGVLNSNTADKKGWTAQLAEANERGSGRDEVIREIQDNGR